MKSTQTRAISFARQKLTEHGFNGVRIEVSERAKRRLGSAKFINKVPFALSLSAYHIRTGKWEDVKDTILHEIAHLIAGIDAGHGPKWKAAARSVGASPERIAHLPESELVPPKWTGRCSCEGKIFKRHRLAKRFLKGSICPSCGDRIDWTRHR